MEPTERIHIAWVHAGEVDAMFAYSIMQLIKAMPHKIGSINCIQGLGLLAKSRNMVVKHFLDNTDEDWIFMVDADEYIGLGEFMLLLENADADTKPFISGLYFAANSQNPISIDPVPLIFINKGAPEGVQPYFDYPDNQLVKIYAAGTGAMLIHRSVLEYMREAGKETYGEDWCWFQDGPLSGNRWLSEDLTFCARVQELGIPMYAHTGAIFPHHKQIWITAETYKTQNKK